MSSSSSSLPLPLSRHSLASSRRHKILFVGGAHGGKTALLERLLHRTFSSSIHCQTFGCELHTVDHSVAAAATERLTLHLWDCGGHERFRPLVQQLYGGVKGAVLVYDMGSDASFAELRYWRNEILRHCPEAAAVMVGTKSDESTRISAEDGAKQAKEWGMTHIMVSAKTGSNVEQIIPALMGTTKKAASNEK